MFIASIVGSSWKSAESNGLAPMRSPAATTSVFLLVASSVLTCVARYSTPPATTVPIRPAEPAGGSRFPWKSLNARSCTSTSGGTRSALSGTRALAPGARIPSATASVNPRMIVFLKLNALSLLSQFRS